MAVNVHLFKGLFKFFSEKLIEKESVHLLPSCVRVGRSLSAH